MFMLYNTIWEGKEELAGKAITEMILNECRNYLIRHDALDSIAADTIIDGKCIMAESEYELVDHSRLRNLVTDTLYYSIMELELDPEKFIVRKFLQLIKHMKSSEGYIPDLMESVLLYAVAECQQEAPDMVDLQAQLILQLCSDAVLMIEKIRGEAEYVEEQNLDWIFLLMHAFRSLRNLFYEDLDNGMEMFVHDTDYMLLQDNGLLDGLGILYVMDSEYDIRDIFCSIGEPVPLKVEEMLQYVDTHRMEILKKTGESMADILADTKYFLS